MLSTSRRPPSVRTWFPDEIENALRAVDQANNSVASAIKTPEMDLYRLGYVDALNALAAVFGVDPPSRSNTPTGRQP